MSRGRSSQGGFILVLVLGILVILSLLASGVAVTVQRLRDEESDRQQAMLDALDMADTRASVTYLLLTQRRTFGGLTVDSRVALSEDERVAAGAGDDAGALSLMPVGNEITLDGSLYAGSGEVRFALQDDRGRLPVNWVPASSIERYLDSTGKPEAAAAVRLANLLADYQDPDDLYRLNSAEQDGYASQRRRPPTNRPLVTPLELRRVMGWDLALARISDADLVRTLTTVRSASINANTASAEVLRSIPGIDAAMAQRIVDARRLRPFTSMTSVYQVLGAALGDEGLLSLYPMDSGTLALSSPRGGATRVLHWTLTPFDRGGRPWREDYEFALPNDDRAAEGVVRASPATIFARPEASPP
ncbi:general secretion pathway protein GspK [Cognatilysobacter segetis]|uniref:general secretion pathway protein GspK n=1 Tax=Cognatilysobacter segetis TaxID=2492394 RepID=UPI0013905A68|nr:helix-hairpin-helix domain-containing protein [Lysobacter segetis]